MSEKTNDGTLRGPREALEEAIKTIGDSGALEHGKKVLVLALDDTNDNYSVSFMQAGMTMSECNNLCDIAKSVFKKDMGY